MTNWISTRWRKVREKLRNQHRPFWEDTLRTCERLLELEKRRPGSLRKHNSPQKLSELDRIHDVARRELFALDNPDATYVRRDTIRFDDEWEVLYILKCT